MCKFIKTENVPAFIKDHCIDTRPEMYSNVTDALKNELIICDDELKTETLLQIEVESSPSARCKLVETFMYRVESYDSVSSKCILDSYTAIAVPSQH